MKYPHERGCVSIEAGEAVRLALIVLLADLPLKKRNKELLRIERIAARICTDAAADHNVYALHGGGVPAPLTPERSRRMAGAQFLGKVISDIWDSQACRVGDT